MYLGAIWRILVGMHSGEPWKLGRRPGLDGVRGIAILLVLLAHLGPALSTARAGMAGVTVFFTLSGFLITTLLLEERGQTGGVSMRRFYLRRARRLLPAFGMLLAVAWPLEQLIFGHVPYWWTTVLEVNNWVSAEHGAVALRMLQHTWSLAIEEQFYLVWPLLLGVVGHRFGRRGVIAVASFGIGVSLTIVALIGPGFRTSFGTDTNAAPLLAGCLLAALMVGRQVRQAPRWVFPTAVVVGVAGCLSSDLVARCAVPAATVLAIWSVCTGGAQLLAWRPLVGAGRISYSWYLWNYPVAVVMETFRGPMLLVPVVSLVFAWVSWRWVEQPFLRARPHKVAEPGLGRVVVGVSPGVS